MPLLSSDYHPPRWLNGGHVQTILPSLLPRRFQPWQKSERLELADGDFLELRWWRHESPSPLAVLSHGLEGSVQGVYIRSMARTLHQAGWDVLAWNYRGCGGIENRLIRFYHSGETSDLRQIIEHAAKTHEHVALIGFSLGANLSLKCVGEAPAHPAVCAVIAISAPADLASSARMIDDVPGNRLYQQRFLSSLKAKVLRKAQRFPELRVMLTGSDGIRAVRTLSEFDERITAPLHGFSNAADYWARASSLPHLSNITVPTLLLNARNDPLLATPSFPEELAKNSAHLHLEAPDHGGHVGFLDFQNGLQPWHDRRALEFFNQVGM